MVAALFGRRHVALEAFEAFETAPTHAGHPPSSATCPPNARPPYSNHSEAHLQNVLID